MKALSVAFAFKYNYGKKVKCVWCLFSFSNVESFYCSPKSINANENTKIPSVCSKNKVQNRLTRWQQIIKEHTLHACLVSDLGIIIKNIRVSLLVRFK